MFSVYLPPDGSAGSVMFGGYSLQGFKALSASNPVSYQILKTKGKMSWDTSIVKVEYNSVVISDISAFKSTSVIIDPAYPYI